MNDKNGDSKNTTDLDLFRQSVADARPLKQKNVVHQPSRPSPERRRRSQEGAELPPEMLSDECQTEEVESSDELLFSRPGLQHGVIRKLRRGQFSIAAELDLHGMTVSEARDVLLEFIHEAQQHRARCVRVVHGKGHGSTGRLPVLKNRLNNWLRQIDGVLAFSSARPADGGTGAVYVLLKREGGA